MLTGTFVKRTALLTHSSHIRSDHYDTLDGKYAFSNSGFELIGDLGNGDDLTSRTINANMVTLLTSISNPTALYIQPLPDGSKSLRPQTIDHTLWNTSPAK